MRPITDLQRKVAPFQVISDYLPAGDQPAAIEEIARRINAGDQDVVLLGATGTGKSATTAWLIERLQRPTLVLAPNKTLAAQLANEFRELLPNNAVEYFVSYYDYYQPEAYVPQTDTFIEKDSSVNDEVERLRHSATNSLLTRRDVVVVATVSCIYGLGTPQEYIDRMIRLKVGDEIEVKILNVDAKEKTIQLSLKSKNTAKPKAAKKKVEVEEGSDNAGTTNLGALLKAKLDSKK